MPLIALLVAITAGALAAQSLLPLPDLLPATAAARLRTSLDAASRHQRHIWRDTPPFAEERLVTAYVEIAKGDRRKWEFDMRANARAIDRVISEDIGGYPVNYGFVPQTVSYDGDPFDALVLGPPMRGGAAVRGAIVGIMHMEDERGLDSKVVLSPLRKGRPKYALTEAERTRIGDFFNKYKKHEPGKFSRVLGWGSREDGLAFVRQTHQFFERQRSQEKGAEESSQENGRNGTKQLLKEP